MYETERGTTDPKPTFSPGVQTPGRKALTRRNFIVWALGGLLGAIAITCPHLGCSYGLDTGGKRFLCPCHGSTFNLEGQVLHGPAVNPLSHLTWRRGDQPDVVLVDGVNQPG